MMHAIAIDDEPLALELITSFCSKIDGITLDASFTKVAEAIAYLDANKVDLLFLDINMPHMSGLDLYRQIDQQVMVIFTTAYTEYAVDAFSVNALDYILKPFSFERFQQAVQKAIEYMNYTRGSAEQPSRFIYLKADYSLIKIDLAEIFYIEALADYLKIHFDSGKSVVVRLTMKGLFEKLPEQEFIRVHRSYIIPFKSILGIVHKSVQLKNVLIPIGIRYEDDVMLALQAKGF
jgi:DNA-binding LytR/AlgR family response regulator